MRLGIADPWVFLAYILSLASSVLCILYGLFNWNKGDEAIQPEDVKWAKEEKEEVEEVLTPR